MTATGRIPATVVTGFLGAGKTTLIRHLIQNARGRRLALIINEFGDIGIDGELSKRSLRQPRMERRLYCPSPLSQYRPGRCEHPKLQVFRSQSFRYFRKPGRRRLWKRRPGLQLMSGRVLMRVRRPRRRPFLSRNSKAFGRE